MSITLTDISPFEGSPHPDYPDYNVRTSITSDLIMRPGKGWESRKVASEGVTVPTWLHPGGKTHRLLQWLADRLGPMLGHSRVHQAALAAGQAAWYLGSLLLHGHGLLSSLSTESPEDRLIPVDDRLKAEVEIVYGPAQVWRGSLAIGKKQGTRGPSLFLPPTEMCLPEEVQSPKQFLLRLFWENKLVLYSPVPSTCHRLKIGARAKVVKGYGILNLLMNFELGLVRPELVKLQAGGGLTLIETYFKNRAERGMHIPSPALSDPAFPSSWGPDHEPELRRCSPISGQED